MDERELVLDGNAAAGVLVDVFAVEPTLVGTVCAGCGAGGRIGELMAYVHAPGVVLRCRSCESVLIRVVRHPDRLLVDLSGCRSIELSL